eukprot:3768069-Pleurochrysis_carterae.AAC.1
MTLIALSSMLNKVFHVFTPFFLQTVSPGDLSNEKPVASDAPPQILYLALYARDEQYRCVIPADAPITGPGLPSLNFGSKASTFELVGASKAPPLPTASEARPLAASEARPPAASEA